MKLLSLKIKFLFLIIGISAVAFGASETKKDNEKEKIDFVIAASELDKVLLINSNEQIVREIDADNTYDAWKLDNGNVLYAWHYGVKIVTPANHVCFSFDSESEIFACQPLSNGDVLIGECSNGRLIEVNAKGEIAKEVKLTYKNGGHGCFRNARKLDNGHYLVSHYADKTVREYNEKGVLIKEFIRPFNVYAAQRLPNGNTVISDKFCISIYNNEGSVIWEFNTKNYPQLGVYHLTGFQYLSNNEIVVCNWLGHKPYHKGVPVFKINLKKEIVWMYMNARQTYSCANIQVIK